MHSEIGRTQFGMLLWRYRESARLTQEALAERAGLSLRGISDLERGRRRAPHRETVLRLADALELGEADRRALSDSARQLPMPGGATRAGRAWPGPPESLTSFVGRNNEVAQLQELLDHTRLLTLHGPGGIGKTRLAVEIARTSAHAFADGVAFIDLANISDGALVIAAFAAVFNAPESDLTSMESLRAALAPRQMLVVIDNCEHVVDACAHLAYRLLHDCPRIKFLATSRETLNTAGELVWEVPPLDCPPPGASPDGNLFASFDAVRLFIERAKLAQPAFRINAANAASVANICRRLDGIPLAIEMAAAQLRVLAPEQIATRLNDSVAVLVGGSRTAEFRHRTLRATIQWSYELLTEQEQRVFARASVFAGPWSLDAAEAVLSDDDFPPRAVLEVLGRVIDKSLIKTEATDSDEIRYRLLDTLRQYAIEQLEKLRETEALRRRHAQFFLQLAEHGVKHLRGRNQNNWLIRVERDEDNLRAALDWSAAACDAELMQRLAGALATFWARRGYVSEGLMWLSRSLELGESTPRARANASLGAAHLAHFDGRHNDLELAYAQQSLRLWTDLDDDRGIADSLRAVANALLVRGAEERDRVYALFEDSLALCRQLDDATGVAECLAGLANLAWARGDRDRAKLLFEECLSVARTRGGDWQTGYALHALGHLAISADDYRRARELLREALLHSVQTGDRRGISVCLQSLALLWSRRGVAHRAARLFGAAATVRRSFGVGRWGRPWLQLGEGATSLQAQLGQQVFDAEWTAGASLSLDAALAEALDDTPEGRNEVQHTAPLSRREWEVACLVSDGLTNRGIGETLFITEGTAALHVRHILNKLGFASRSQIAAWASRRREKVSSAS